MTVLEAGHTIAGKYRLVRPLAKGGMGAVWVARHTQLDAQVAIKLMDPLLADSEDARTRFEREAKAAAMLKSPHVVQAHDYGIDGEIPYIAMELLEGEDLESRLSQTGQLGIATTAKIVGQVCKALRRAHDAGLVHRDLKPANIFLARVDDEEVVKVLDFGIAKVTGAAIEGSATKTGMLIGSPHYMSPEQVRRSKLVDHRTDLWALGVIVYRCLTGKLPFDGEEIGDLLVEICSDPLPAPSSVEPGLGRDVDAFIAKALAREPDRRFQSARELAEACHALEGADGPESPVVTRLTSPDVATLAAPITVAAPRRAETPGTLVPSDASVGVPPKRRGWLGAGIVMTIAAGVGIAALLAPSDRTRHALPDAGVSAHVSPLTTATVTVSAAPAATSEPTATPSAEPEKAAPASTAVEIDAGAPPKKERAAPRAAPQPKPDPKRPPKQEPAEKPYDPTREM